VTLAPVGNLTGGAVPTDDTVRSIVIPEEARVRYETYRPVTVTVNWAVWDCCVTEKE
jgi:hypothetical protein